MVVDTVRQARNMSNMGKVLLGYWNIRGFGEPARMMMEYAGIEYNQKVYTYGEAPDYGKHWYPEKYNLGLSFPNLPYLFDGEVKISETWAIYKYLGKKAGLLPSTAKEECECDMVAGVVSDVRLAEAFLVYFPGMMERMAETKEKQQEKIRQLDKFFSKRQYVAGQKLTYVDFALYEMVDHLRALFPDILDGQNCLQGFMKRFESLPQISSYFSSERYKKFPIYGTMASWGGKDHDDRTW